MKRHVSPHVVACLMLGCMAALHAQSLPGNHHANPCDELSGTASRVPQSGASAAFYEVPPVERVHGAVSEKPPVFTLQDAPSLKLAPAATEGAPRSEVSDILRQPTPYRRMAAKTRGQYLEAAAGSIQNGLILVASMYRELGKPESGTDCETIALSVAHRVKNDSSRVLEFVEREVTANPACACEIVKAAIQASDTDPVLVAAIAETAIHAAPDAMRLISQCAIAASPGSLSAIQSLLARLDTNAGESGYSGKSAKDSKGAKVPSVEPPAAAGNPLDLPFVPPIMPPPIFPPNVTEVNP
jgi:hypothetical protein